MLNDVKVVVLSERSCCVIPMGSCSELVVTRSRSLVEVGGAGSVQVVTLFEEGTSDRRLRREGSLP